MTAQPRLAQDAKFKLAGAPLYAEPNAVAIEKGDPEFAATLREIIDGLRQDGTLKRISDKWIGADISQ